MSKHHRHTSDVLLVAAIQYAIRYSRFEKKGCLKMASGLKS